MHNQNTVYKILKELIERRKHPTRSIVKIIKRIKSVFSHYSYPTLN